MFMFFLPYVYSKIWREMIEPEDNEFLFNGMNVENKEVFRLRELRKRNKKIQAYNNEQI